MEDGVKHVLACNIPLILVTTLCICVKIYTRFKLYRKSFWDDACAVMGYVFAMVICAANCVMTRYGLGKHIESVPASDLPPLLRLAFLTEISYIISFVFSKFAFVFFYLTIFPSLTCRRINIFVGTILLLQLIEEITVVLLQCRPLHKFWDTEVDGTCLDLILFFYISFGIKFVTDLMLFCVPIPMLKGLKIKKGRKWVVIVMFSSGLLVCIISVIRVALIKSTGTDVTWLLAIELNWSAIEICSITICFCIPSFLAFIRLFPTLAQLFRVSSPLAPSQHSRSSRSKSSKPRVQKSYPLSERSNWLGGGNGGGNNTIITTVRRGKEDEEIGNRNESQVDILAVDVEGHTEEELMTITIVKSVRVVNSLDRGNRNY